MQQASTFFMQPALMWRSRINLMRNHVNCVRVFLMQPALMWRRITLMRNHVNCVRVFLMQQALIWRRDPPHADPRELRPGFLMQSALMLRRDPPHAELRELRPGGWPPPPMSQPRRNADEGIDDGVVAQAVPREGPCGTMRVRTHSSEWTACHRP